MPTATYIPNQSCIMASILLYHCNDLRYSLIRNRTNPYFSHSQDCAFIHLYNLRRSTVVSEIGGSYSELRQSLRIKRSDRCKKRRDFLYGLRPQESIPAISQSRRRRPRGLVGVPDACLGVRPSITMGNINIWMVHILLFYRHLPTSGQVATIAHHGMDILRNEI